MKTYISPELDMKNFENEEVITTSSMVEPSDTVPGLQGEKNVQKFSISDAKKMTKIVF